MPEASELGLFRKDLSFSTSSDEKKWGVMMTKYSITEQTQFNNHPDGANMDIQILNRRYRWCR